MSLDEFARRYQMVDPKGVVELGRELVKAQVQVAALKKSVAADWRAVCKVGDALSDLFERLSNLLVCAEVEEGAAPLEAPAPEQTTTLEDSFREFLERNERFGQQDVADALNISRFRAGQLLKGVGDYGFRVVRPQNQEGKRPKVYERGVPAKKVQRPLRPILSERLTDIIPQEGHLLCRPISGSTRCAWFLVIHGAADSLYVEDLDEVSDVDGGAAVRPRLVKTSRTSLIRADDFGCYNVYMPFVFKGSTILFRENQDSIAREVPARFSFQPVRRGSAVQHLGLSFQDGGRDRFFCLTSPCSAKFPDNRSRIPFRAVPNPPQYALAGV